MNSKLIFLLVLVTACSSDNKSVDAKVYNDALPVCGGAVYDPCNPASNNCMNSVMCKTFTGSSFSACAPTCSASTPCPNQGTTAVTCMTTMGICKPTAPNTDCTSP